MKGVVYLGNHVVEVNKNLEIPEPGPDQALVKIAYAALCATDIHGMEGLIGGPSRINATRAIGHECSGVIEKTRQQKPRARASRSATAWYAIRAHTAASATDADRAKNACLLRPRQAADAWQNIRHII
jgi:D-arabinose 1-dehydrogenase-like Zn-dependent alcohol dehydrogenase